MEERRAWVALGCYLVLSAAFYAKVAAWCEEFAASGRYSAVVFLYVLPAVVVLWLRGKPKGRWVITGARKRPWAAFVVLGLLFGSLPLLYLRFAVAGEDAAAARSAPENPWLFALLAGGLGMAYFWKSPAPQATRLPFRGKQLHDEEEAKQRALAYQERVGERPLLWGGLALPRQAGRLHFAVCGVTGSGKTLTLRLLMQSVLPRLGQDTRALVYDAKGDMHSLLAGMGAKNILTLNPFDKRSVAPDFAEDFTSPASALQLASLIIPTNPHASQPFFDNAARSVLTKVIVSLIHGQTAWELRDVILATRTKSAVEEILSRCPESESALEYFERPETARDILSTLAAHLAPLEVIAAAWSRAERKISLRRWLTEDSILLLGNDETLRTAMQAMNRLLFERLSELLLQQSGSNTRETWIFLDEAREAGKLSGLSRLLTNGRSKGVCVCLGFQDIHGLREVYGERVAHEIIGQCGNKAVLRLESEATAKWAAEQFGACEVLEESTSEGQSLQGLRRGLSSSRSLAIRQTYNVLPSEFLSLPPTDERNGLTGYYQTPYTGAFKKRLSSGWLSERLLPARKDVPNALPRSEADQYLTRWTVKDRARLGLGASTPRWEGVAFANQEDESAPLRGLWKRESPERTFAHQKSRKF